MDFEGFIDWFNDEMSFGADHDIGVAMSESFERHFGNGAEYDEAPYIRASNLGKPAVLLALQKLGYTEPKMQGRVKFACYLGDVWEAAVEVFLKQYGYHIVESQGSVEWNGISGHYDFVVGSESGGQYLVEAKALSPNYSRIFQKEPNDDRGYITQLAIYRSQVQLPALWLCFNKGTGEAFLVRPESSVLQSALVRAEKVLERVEKVQSPQGVLEYFRPPPPRKEVYRRQDTGRNLLPSSMAFSPFKSAFYLITNDLNGYKKPTDYVDGVADADHLVEELDYLVQTGAVVKHDV